MLSVCVRPRPLPSPPPTDGFTSEGEILEISDIQRGQAGEYECVTHNGVNSAPDSRRVLVTVNCEPPTPGTVHESGAGPGTPVMKSVREEEGGGSAGGRGLRGGCQRTWTLGRRRGWGVRPLRPHWARKIR